MIRIISPTQKINQNNKSLRQTHHLSLTCSNKHNRRDSDQRLINSNEQIESKSMQLSTTDLNLIIS